MRVPVSTYRLQLNDGFTLGDARTIVPYLAQLGITDLYLSPLFQAMPGSPHGYDVTDPTRVRESLGGREALQALADEARRHDMGILLDIVPNHMAASPHNRWWRDVLENGRRSSYAHFFDIDWEALQPGRLRLPVLGDSLEEVVRRGEITIDAAAREVVYFESRYPLAPGSMTGDMADLQGPARDAAILAVLQRQHYELAFWRTASQRMNYRRFFDITDLAAVRVEKEDVFDATHVLIRELAADGTITGLRIDHIDGLRDPAGYLRQLRRKVRGPGGEPVYTVVEKILEREEKLPADWACEGTTGYEFLNLATGLLIEPHGYRRLEEIYTRLTGDAKPFAELVREKKLLIMDRLFGSEVSALAQSLTSITGLGEGDARQAVVQVTASMSVYRSYLRSRRVDPADQERLDEAAQDARRRNPGLAEAIDLMHRVVCLEDEPVSEATLDWVMRWQQLTGPVMAKGFEDTALYCHNVLLAANDVGSDPVDPGLSAAQLRAMLAGRRDQSPHSLNTTATHDTKRGEDTRARIAVLSEVPEEWRRRVRRWSREGEEWKAEIADEFEDDVAVPDADVDSLLYQTLVGAWPLAGPDAHGTGDEAFPSRIQEYMTKAVREAKEQTSWRRPDEDYEQALDAFIQRLMEEFGREGLADEVAEFARLVAPHGAVNSLAQTLLRITAPGIPDTYQGTELWSFTLVDPDNRAPVDYQHRMKLAAELAPLLEAPSPDGMGALLREWQDGRIKLAVTALALRCRARRADVFDHGSCQSLAAAGPAAGSVVAYARSLDGDACISILPRWTTRLAGLGNLPAGEHWKDSRLELPATLQGRWHSVFTGETLDAGEDGLALPELFAALPLALLERP
jgi:(1->4)-alpha-D-glucan 1-alpha-D-glucosylmutase